MDLPSIQQLRNFVIYGKYGNFTTAANAANITQSAFSAQMKKLEDLVGVRLIERSNRGSHLTPAGKLFYTKIARILGELEEAMSELPGRMGKTQPLSVGIMLSLGDVHMNRHLAYFQEHHSGASFRVYNLEVREMIQWLKEDRLDIVSLFYLPALHLEEYEKVFFGIENLVYYGPNLKLPEHAVTPQYVASQPLFHVPRLSTSGDAGLVLDALCHDELLSAEPHRGYPAGTLPPGHGHCRRLLRIGTAPAPSVLSRV